MNKHSAHSRISKIFADKRMSNDTFSITLRPFEQQEVLDTIRDIDINEIIPDPSDTIDFAEYLVGHDKETIIQMYNDWKKRPK